MDCECVESGMCGLMNQLLELSQHPRIIYFRAYVHHSLTYSEPLTVFVAMNGVSGDVHAAKCNCVSG